MRLFLASGIVVVSAVALTGCGQGGAGLTGTATIPSITRTTPTLPAATHTEGATTILDTTAPLTTVVTQPTTTVVTTTQPPTTNHVTVTPIQTLTRIETETGAPTTVVTTTTTAGVNTTAVVAAGAAAAAASQQQEPESTPWGWVVFGLLAAGLAGAGIFWLVRRDRDKKPPGPGEAPPPGETV